MFKRFLLRCKNEKCKKVLLRENPAIKFVVGNKPQFSASDVDTGEIVVLPIVWCKHCKVRNDFVESDCVETSGKNIIEKRLLAKQIREELTTVERRILIDAEKEGGDVESVIIEDVSVIFKKPAIKGKNQDVKSDLDLTKGF